MAFVEKFWFPSWPIRSRRITLEDSNPPHALSFDGLLESLRGIQDVGSGLCGQRPGPELGFCVRGVERRTRSSLPTLAMNTAYPRCPIWTD